MTKFEQALLRPPPADRCAPCGNLWAHGKQDARECTLMAQRRAKYREGWTRIKDLPAWARPYEIPWRPKLCIKEYARRHGGEAIFCQTVSSRGARNYWLATWTLHVVWSQYAGLRPEDDHQEHLENTVEILHLTAQNMRTVPEEWKRHEAIHPWLYAWSTPWATEWFRAGQPLPEG